MTTTSPSRKREDALEQELARARRDLELFAHATSHDLQEPSRIITQFLRLLETRYAGALDERGRSYIANAVEGASRMDALLQGLLEYSRVTTRGKPIEMTDAEAAFSRACSYLENQIAATGTTITHAPFSPVVADGAQLTKAFHILLDNAMKFHEGPTPHIRVTQERASNEWVFTVTDDGIGFEMEYAERIFDIYQRLHTREEYAGNGLGLAICKRIVERHGGRIWARSRRRHGSTFSFTIPDRDAAPT